MALASDVGVDHVVSPNTLYYLALYLLVLVVSFFKLRRDSSKTFSKRRVFHVGLEVVYTASGLVVLLLADLKEYAPFIIISYLILVLISSQIESLADRFSANGVFWTHLVIVFLIIGTTIMYFDVVQPRLVKQRLAKAEAETTAAKKAESAPSRLEFRVAVPYTDRSLAKHLGSFNRPLVWIQTVEALSERDARQVAIQRAKEGVKPFKSRPENEDAQIEFDLDRVVVQLLSGAAIRN